MRKRKLVIIVLAVCLLCFTAFAACTDKTDYGTLTVADVTVTVGQSKDLTPEFSKEEGKGEVSYTFSGSKLSIADGKVIGACGRYRNDRDRDDRASFSIV